MTSPSAVRYFLGCNSAHGFYSLFDRFTDPAADWRCILIKGGPGTGKSTLMRRVAEAARAHALPLEEIHCSSDVDSLDGIVLPQQKTVLLDATPPHALEPRHPGAVEQTLSLCDCWDESLLRAHRKEIVAVTAQISACHRQAVRYLAGAEALLREVRQLAEPHLDREKLARYARRFAERELPRRDGTGQQQECLLSAVTNRGRVLYDTTAEAHCPRLILLEDAAGAAAPLLLELLRREALQRGYSVIRCGCPLAPAEKTDHLLLPEAGLGLLTSDRWHTPAVAGRAVHLQRFYDNEGLKGCRVRTRFLQKTAALLLRQAELAIAEAKSRHDALERYYIAAMDFDAVSAKTDAFLTALQKEW